MGGQILVELPDTKFRENLNLFRVYKTEASTCAAQRYQEERRRKTKKSKGGRNVFHKDRVVQKSH